MIAREENRTLRRGLLKSLICSMIQRGAPPEEIAEWLTTYVEDMLFVHLRMSAIAARLERESLERESR